MNRRSLAHRRPAPGEVRGSAGERGVVGGLEVLPFGLLIFVVGTLLVTNAWAVVDAKMATGSAAREAARVFVEAPSAEAGWPAARRAADDAMTSYGRDPRHLALSYDDQVPFERCQRITVVATETVPTISLPFGVGFGHGIHVTSAHSEIIDPLRSGLGERNTCGY